MLVVVGGRALQGLAELRGDVAEDGGEGPGRHAEPELPAEEPRGPGRRPRLRRRRRRVGAAAPRPLDAHPRRVGEHGAGDDAGRPATREERPGARGRAARRRGAAGRITCVVEAAAQAAVRVRAGSVRVVGARVVIAAAGAARARRVQGAFRRLAAVLAVLLLARRSGRL